MFRELEKAVQGVDPIGHIHGNAASCLHLCEIKISRHNVIKRQQLVLRAVVFSNKGIALGRVASGK